VSFFIVECSAHGNRSVTAVILVLEIIELSVFIYVCFKDANGAGVIEFNPARRWLSKGALADSIFLLCPCKGASTVKPRAHFTVQNLVVEKRYMAPWILATARMPQTACTTRPNR